MIRWLAFSVSLVLIGLLGALLSKKINSGDLPWYIAILPSVVSGGVWGVFVRHKGINLSYASALFDVVYTASYVLGFILLGDRLTPVQFLGFLISSFGIALMSL